MRCGGIGAWGITPPLRTDLHVCHSCLHDPLQVPKRGKERRLLMEEAVKANIIRFSGVEIRIGTTLSSNRRTGQTNLLVHEAGLNPKAVLIVGTDMHREYAEQLLRDRYLNPFATSRRRWCITVHELLSGHFMDISDRLLLWDNTAVHEIMRLMRQQLTTETEQEAGQ